MSQRDYVLCLDKSGSMTNPNKSGSGGVSRWVAAQEIVMSLARKAAETDPDGIDVYTFNNGFTKFENTTPDKVANLFSSESPYGGTSLVPVLTDALENHFKKNARATTIVVLTDGESTDGPATAKLITAAANRIEADNDLAIGFIQVGDDPAATKFLKGLDDDLVKAGAKFDIVDTLTVDELNTMTPEQALAHIISD